MYSPHTEADRKAMLDRIGIQDVSDLFQCLPAEHRFPDLDLPPGLTEIELLTELEGVAWANDSAQEMISFLGAGAYNHYIPAVVDTILQRGEFYTAYTPYQPEISQGTLQAIFEYQSLIAGLTGMDVSNASHYDGATAVAEAVNMAFHIYRGKRSKVVISPAIHPHYRQTIQTYTRGTEIELFCPDKSSELVAGPESLYPLIDESTCLVLVAYPDFFGRVYDYSELAEVVHEAGALLAISTNPLALGLLKTPGDFNADIVTGEGQPLGIPLSFGGPYLGYFATKEKFVRKMSGRLVGETVDNRGQRAYVLTLTAREQHIRRDKATSNICTNQGLMALAATVYMSLLGKHGLRQVAELCYHKAHYTAKSIDTLPGYQLWYKVPFFNEFVIECPISAAEVNEQMLDQNIIAGYDLGQDFPELKNHLLVAVTEMNTRQDIDTFIEVLGELTND